jgi:hypothetical protein
MAFDQTENPIRSLQVLWNFSFTVVTRKHQKAPRSIKPLLLLFQYNITSRSTLLLIAVFQVLFIDIERFTEPPGHSIGIKAAAAFIIADHALADTELFGELSLRQSAGA